MENDIRNDMKKLKIKNWTSCIQDRNNWQDMFRRPKHSTIGVVATKEEEEEEEEGALNRRLHSSKRTVSSCLSSLFLQAIGLVQHRI
jgi:hypothetical protein